MCWTRERITGRSSSAASLVGAWSGGVRSVGEEGTEGLRDGTEEAEETEYRLLQSILVGRLTASLSRRSGEKGENMAGTRERERLCCSNTVVVSVLVLMRRSADR